MSNKPSLSFFVHGFPVLKSRDFLACFMIEISLSEMVVKLEAQDNQMILIRGKVLALVVK
jgi:hypothetical protein